VANSFASKGRFVRLAFIRFGSTVFIGIGSAFQALDHRLSMDMDHWLSVIHRFSTDLDSFLDILVFTESVVFKDVYPFTITYTATERLPLEKMEVTLSFSKENPAFPFKIEYSPGVFS
jgi:hypothetical protein